MMQPIVFVNGQFDATRSSLECLPSEVSLTQTGLCVRFPRGVIHERPLYFLFVNTSDVLEGTWHIAIIAEEGSHGMVCEVYQGEGAYTRRVTSEWTLEANAVLKHYKIQNESSVADHAASTVVFQSHYSQLLSHAWSLGAAVGEEKWDVALQEKGAQVWLCGLYMSGRAQRLKQDIHVHHYQSDTMSQQLYKGVIGAHGEASFHGKIQVYAGAQRSRAEQHNPNLLLADNAVIYSQPELEIDTDDVQCRHGATVGQLDEQALFYLRSRGIEKECGRDLLIEAFTAEITGFVPVPLATDVIGPCVRAKLSTLRDVS